jgi:uncharacterized HAD superfamily protein
MHEFREYLVAEYRHIAEAHFRTIEAISSFFRYYLLIMSVPITVLAIFVGISNNLEVIVNIIENLRPVLVATLIVISVVGFFVMLYIVNLRMDVILYARTVNAIRKHFYDQAPVDTNIKLHTRVLPQTPMQPSYDEPRYFLPVILSFAFFNTFYMVLALILAGLSLHGTAGIGSWLDRVSWWSWLGFIFLPVHLGFYKLYARYREHSYLRSFALGVDIDGVLNEHRHHFAKLLEENVSIGLDPDTITTIPLHDCPALKVSRGDEKQVFNDPRYWVEMPARDDAAPNLTKLRNLNLKVHIFSHRAWPNTSDMKQTDREEIHKEWNDQALALMRKTYGSRSLRSVFNRIQLWMGFPGEETTKIAWYRVDRRLSSWIQMKFGSRPIEQFTKCWLRLHNIDCDDLTIEQGNEDVADPQGHFHNRFYIARKKQIRFFVEDDLDKAIKLAYICDIVFLLDHPYNRNTQDRCQKCIRKCKQERRDVPDNVTRVESWGEIYRYILRVS